jgi:hypothetical protein
VLLDVRLAGPEAEADADTDAEAEEGDELDNWLPHLPKPF